MSIKSIIKDGSGSGAEAKVTSRGQLITAPLEFSDPLTIDLTTTGIAYNFFKPKSGRRFVITEIFVHTNRTSPTGGTLIEIFEASEVDSITIDRSLFKVDLARQVGVGHGSLNWIISEGVWLNAKTDTSTGISSVTVAGYYIAT